VLRSMLRLVRVFLVGVLFLVLSFFINFLFLLRFRHHSNSAIYCRIMSPIARWILGINVVLRNSENILASQPCVYIGNHQAALDLVTYGSFFPVKTSILAKRSLIYVPLFGWTTWLAGNLLINRSDKKAALGTMDEASLAIQKHGSSIWIFPEGTRTHGSGLAPFKKGAFHCAVSNNIPLQPIVVSTYKGNVNFGYWNSGTVIVEVLPPIYPEQSSLEEVERLRIKSFETIAAAIARLDAELASGKLA
jgi:1-acyl-sn-glycerol-3-phosphate acyltransferase